MQNALLPMCLTLAVLLGAAAPAIAQQSYYAQAAPSEITGHEATSNSAMQVDEPQRFDAPTNVEARPIDGPAGALSGHAEAPHFPVRLSAAEIPAAPLAAQEPLKLTPRNATGNKKLVKPLVPTPGGAAGTVAASLGIVLGLFLVLAWCCRRFAPAGSAQLPKEAIELLGRAPLSAKQQMQLVRVGNKLLVVALSATGAETLTEITDPVEVERLLALCRRGQPTSASASFGQLLGQMERETTTSNASPSRTRVRGAS
jgi:flagellar biogenesis protein FliO